MNNMDPFASSKNTINDTDLYSTKTSTSTLSAFANSFEPSAHTTASIQETILNQINTDSFNNFITYATFNPTSSVSSSSSRSSSSSISLSEQSNNGFNSHKSNFNISQIMAPLPPLFDDVNVNHDLTNLHINRFLSSASSSFGASLPPLPLPSMSCQKRTKLFVGNLSSDTTLTELIELFSRYGVVNEKLCVVKDDNYAFIHFFSEISAENACQNLNDSFFKNRFIRVQYSTSQGHLKKTINVARPQTNEQIVRSASALFLNEALLAKYLPSIAKTTRDSTVSSYCLTNEQLKTNLIVPTSFLKSLESNSKNFEFNSMPKRHPLTSSQSVQSFGSVGAGRPILKAKLVQ